MAKACAKCRAVFPLSGFPKSEGSPDGHRRECKRCQVDAAKAYRRANREKVDAYRRRYQKTPMGRLVDFKTQIKKKYGLTLEAYRALMGEQNGVCRICGRINDRRGLHVDHKHVDGYDKLPPAEKAKLVRGLLCSACNTAIGLLREDVALLASAANCLRATNG